MLLKAAFLFIIAAAFASTIPENVKRAADCSSMTCQHNEMCILETVYCKRDPCPPVPTCVDKSGDICKFKPCQNGGLCFRHTQNGYTCTCPVGYVGVSCETKIPCLVDMLDNSCPKCKTVGALTQRITPIS